MNVRFHLLMPLIVQGMIFLRPARAAGSGAPPRRNCSGCCASAMRSSPSAASCGAAGAATGGSATAAGRDEGQAGRAGKAAETTPPVSTAAEPAAPAGAAPPTEAAAKPAGAGQVVVDEQAAERALERSLVSTGVLLLAPGQVEISPSLSYTRDASGTPTFLDQNGATFAASNNFRRNTLDAALELSFGMPFDLQLEFGLPYSWADQYQRHHGRRAVAAGQQRARLGLGDLSIGAAKTLLRDKGWQPDLIGRVTWNTGTGQTNDNGVTLDGGFDELSFQLTASKRQDPLV